MRAKEIIDYHYYNLIVLEEFVASTNSVRAIQFSDDPQQMKGTGLVEVVGWGKVTKGADQVADELMYLATEPLSEAECERAYGDVFDEVPDGIPIFCVGHPPGYGVFDDTESVAVRNGVLQGFGVYREESEAMDHPALFVHVSIFVKKVRKTIRKYSMK